VAHYPNAGQIAFLEDVCQCPVLASLPPALTGFVFPNKAMVMEIGQSHLWLAKGRFLSCEIAYRNLVRLKPHCNQHFSQRELLFLK